MMVHLGFLLEKNNLRWNATEKKVFSNAESVLLISLSCYYPSVVYIVDASPIKPQYLLFLYRLTVSYCKHV